AEQREHCCGIVAVIVCHLDRLQTRAPDALALLACFLACGCLSSLRLRGCKGRIVIKRGDGRNVESLIVVVAHGKRSNDAGLTLDPSDWRIMRDHTVTAGPQQSSAGL